MSKWNLFKVIVGQAAPILLPLVPGGTTLTPLIPVIVQGIQEAEEIAEASGPEKKAHVINLATAAATALNATGKVQVDVTAVQQVAATGIDTVVAAVNVVKDSHEKLPEP